MTNDEIIKMAVEAGFTSLGKEAWDGFDSDLERFAALVAAHEREECAKVCDPANDHVYTPNSIDVMQSCAAAIRARGEA